ncbi:MAG TPA: hypothetical protein PK228_01775, partial [Saprospiraceae bacterium]|nr:hypothetical protein [Saprospiraceae bacterium]
MNSTDCQPFIKLLQTCLLKVGHFGLFILLIVTFLFQNCSDGNKKITPQKPETTTAPVIPEPAQETASDKPTETTAMPLEKKVETLRENKTNRVGTVPTGKDAELNQTVVAPPTVVPAKKSAPSGPTGYISRNNVVLQSEPITNAPQTRTFKIYEEVIILETKM